MKKIINWDDFEKIDLRVGTIIKAVGFKKAEPQLDDVYFIALKEDQLNSSQS